MKIVIIIILMYYCIIIIIVIIIIIIILLLLLLLSLSLALSNLITSDYQPTVLDISVHNSSVCPWQACYNSVLRVCTLNLSG